MLTFILFFGAIITLFVVVSTTITKSHISTFSSRSTVAISHSATLPQIPRNLAQIHSMMDPKQFELFSAAVIIALGEGHYFRLHSGGAGDHGVDTVLRNVHHNRVIVQSKLYTQGTNVEPTHVRDFWGALSIHNAVYGFLVTTSELSKQALQTVQWSQGRIRVIDGRQLEILLQHRSHEIAMAYKAVLDATT